MEIIDSHVHYWEGPREDRPWVAGAPQIGHAYPAEQVIAEATEGGATKVVQVTPGLTGYDNSYAFECAEKYPDRIAGIFVRFDPLGDRVAERLATMYRHPKMWGVRL